MKEELRQKLNEQLPETLHIDDAMDYPKDNMCKVRGSIGIYAIVIQWDYEASPNSVFLEAFGPYGSNRGEVSLDKLKEALESLVNIQNKEEQNARIEN